jgi:hypothetical protein
MAPNNSEDSRPRSVGQHQHFPAQTKGGAETAKQAEPVGIPGVLDASRQDGPGDGDAHAADDDADAQDVEALAEVGGVQGQSQAIAPEQGQNPGQQRGEAVGDGEVGAFGASSFGTVLVLGVLVELLQTLAEGVLDKSKVLGQVQGDGAQSAASGEDHAEAPQSQGDEERLGRVGEAPGEFALPVVEFGRLARHGGSSPRRPGSGKHPKHSGQPGLAFPFPFSLALNRRVISTSAENLPL